MAQTALSSNWVPRACGSWLLGSLDKGTYIGTYIGTLLMLSDVPIVGFDWDHGNRNKCQRHGVSAAEIEAVLLPTRVHLCFRTSAFAQRTSLIAIGRSQAGRSVFVVFTLRRRNEDMFIRPVSARYMHQKKVEYYEKEIARSQNR